MAHFTVLYCCMRCLDMTCMVCMLIGIYSANSPRLLLFDARPGGLGLSLHLFTRNQPAQLQPHSQPDAQTQQSQRSTSQEGTTNGGCDAPTASATSMLLLEEALHLMRDCKGCSRRCATGCPRCVLDGRYDNYAHTIMNTMLSQ